MAAETPYGFIGLGIMGRGMALNLLKKGFKVVVWNRSVDKCDELVKAGATLAASPADAIKACSITFAMLADPEVAERVAFQDDGVVSAISPGKGYVDCSTVDEACSQRIAAAVAAAGGQFLEAPVSGSKKPAEDGQLIFLTAGDKALFDAVAAPLAAMGKKSLFLGPVGAGARMKLVVNMIMGSMLNAFAEGMSLADAAGLQTGDLLDVLEGGAMANPMFRLKGPAMQKGEYPPAFPLKHAQKDMRLALALADKLELGLPVAAAANESFKRARGEGRGDEDFAAVHAVLTKPAK